jgi:hypothetical protein
MGFSGIGCIAHTLWLHLRGSFSKAQPNVEGAGTPLEILHHTHGDGEDSVCSIMATTFYFLTRS